VEHLVDEQLAFAIGVAGMDHALRIAKQTPDRRQELGRGDLELPVPRRDGQGLEPPSSVRIAVRFGRRHLQDVARAPRDHVARAALDVQADSLLRPGERLGDGAGETRLFGNEQAHGWQTDPFAARA
jgi:hypothetical protein